MDLTIDDSKSNFPIMFVEEHPCKFIYKQVNKNILYEKVGGI